jgi:hypothetical protein
MNFWAKTFADDVSASPRPLFKPVLHHLLDVAAVAEAFLRAQPQRLARESRRGGMEPDAYVRLMSMLAGLHDLGKFSRVFQSLRLDCQRRSKIRPLGRSKSRPFGDVVGHEGETTARLSWSGLLGRAGVVSRWR